MEKPKGKLNKTERLELEKVCKEFNLDPKKRLIDQWEEFMDEKATKTAKNSKKKRTVTFRDSTDAGDCKK